MQKFILRAYRLGYDATPNYDLFQADLDNLYEPLNLFYEKQLMKKTDYSDYILRKVGSFKVIMDVI